MNPSHFDPLPGETALALEAYITWFGLKDRKLKQVAEIIDVELQTVKNWSSQFNWGQRLLRYKADLLVDRAQTEAEVMKKQALERAEAERQQTHERAVRIRQMRESYWRMSEDYVLHNSDKTRLSELTKLMMAIEKLERMDEETERAHQPSRQSEVDRQFEEELHRIYGRHAEIESAYRAYDEAFTDGAGI